MHLIDAGTRGNREALALQTAPVKLGSLALRTAPVKLAVRLVQVAMQRSALILGHALAALVRPRLASAVAAIPAVAALAALVAPALAAFLGLREQKPARSVPGAGDSGTRGYAGSEQYCKQRVFHPFTEPQNRLSASWRSL